MKLHPWVTRHGAEPLPSEDENCTLVEVTEEEVENSVKHIPSLATVVRRMTLTKSRDRESLQQAQRGQTKPTGLSFRKGLGLPSPQPLALGLGHGSGMMDPVTAMCS